MTGKTRFKKRSEEELDDYVRKDGSNLKALLYSCPHCREDNGSFAQIHVYREPNGKVTQYGCNGQEERCVVAATLARTMGFNG